MQDINTLKKRFLALNRERLMRTREALRPRQRDVMDLLPLLFHINHPGLPGFISTETPVGISEYSPNKRSIDAGKKIVRGFEFHNRALLKYDIHALFLMGSSGSIAYNANSDFDIWLCHRSDLAAKERALLQKKATAIELWAEEFSLEVHFFLMDAQKFKSGENVELSSESSGSAQHHLLLEEFYRTGLLFAGRFPVWWLVPPEKEHKYEAYIKDMVRRRFVRDGEIIDFGGMPSGLEQEFFGAALWQLYKSVDSPYKAVLKLMLMEAYAAEHPNVELLCMRFKQAIYDGEKNPENLDPYVMLYNKIAEYLQQQNDEERLALIRRCFYFKVNQRLGDRESAANASWQRDTMKALTHTWGWDPGYMSLLDERTSWKIDRVIDERRSLVSALTQSYQLLSDFARNNTTLSDINQKDLHILGRKLYAAFERKSGKIDIINRGISKDIWESHTTFHETSLGEEKGWSLFQGTVYADEVATTKPLKRSHSIVELVVWCFLNRLIDQRTVIALYPQESTISLNDIKAITRGLTQIFPDARPTDTKVDDLIKPPKLASSAIFVNIGREPSKARLSKGMQLTSDHTDALSYGGVGENLIMSLDHVMQNSWQEVMSYRYEGEQGLLDCLGAYMQWSPPSMGTPPPKIQCHCFTTGRGMTIAKRIEYLFDSVVHCFYNNKSHAETRYILRIGHTYYAITVEMDVFKNRLIGNNVELLRYLAEPCHTYMPTVIDSEALTNTPLPIIYRNNKPGTIQLFYENTGGAIEVYILDEKGSLFYQHLKQADEQIILNQFKRFIDSVIHKQAIQLGAAVEGKKSCKAEYYQIIKDNSRKRRLLPLDVGNDPRSHNYFNLRVLVDTAETGKTAFTLIINDGDFTSLEYGDQVFHEVAKHVIASRKSGLGYPIYITDIELSRPIQGKEQTEHLQTIYFLTYKRTIEEKLNHALVQLHRPKSANG